MSAKSGEDQEAGEAASATRLADRAIEAERRQEGRAGRDPEAQRELDAERAIVAGAQQSAARDTRQAAGAAEAARVLAEQPSPVARARSHPDGRAG